MIKAIMFDWDGTLLKSLGIKAQNGGKIFNKYFALDVEVVRQTYLEFSGIPRRELFDKISVATQKITLEDSVYKRMSDDFSKENIISLANCGLQEGAIETLSILKKKKIKLYISTSAVQEEVDSLVESYKIKLFFDGVLGSSIGFSKGREHCLYVSEKLGISCQEILMLGDEKADIRLAKEAGVVSAGITHGVENSPLIAQSPEILITNLSNLVDVVNHRS